MGCWLAAEARSQGVHAEMFIPSKDSLFRQDIQQDSTVYFVRTVIITGNKKTRDNIAFREVVVKQGKTYTGKELHLLLRLSREQLMNTTLFVNVSSSMYHAGGNMLDVVFTVNERWYLWPVPYFKVVDRNWNVWINDYKASLDRTQFGLKMVHNNTTGRNDKFNLWVIGGYTQMLEFKYQLPYVDRKLQNGFTVGMNYGRNRELNYATDSNKQQFLTLPNFGRQHMKSELSFSYRKGSRMRMNARTLFGYEKIDSAFFKLNPNYLGGYTQASFFDLLLSYQYFNVDYIPFPLRGWYVDFYGLNRFSKAIPMTQFGGRMLATWEFLPKTYVNFQTAFSYTLQKNQPYYNTKLMGYGNIWMQGLEYYVMDGTFGVVGRTTLRRKLFTWDFVGPEKWKTYSRIPFTFYLKTYGNLGYAYHNTPGNNYMNNILLRTAGLGLEIATIYDMVFKLDYSFNQFGQSGFFIHTSADF
jgi:outer membrane protein assembly factor BamA